MESWRRYLAVLSLISVTGCSLALSGPDAKRPPNRVPHCDTGKGLIAVDAVAGSVLATTSLVALSDDESGIALVSGLVAAAYLGATLVANGKVNACREAFAAYRGPGDDGDDRDPDDEPTRTASSGTSAPRPALPPAYAAPAPAATAPAPVVAPPPAAVAPIAPASAPPTPTAAPAAPASPPAKDKRTAPRSKPGDDESLDWRDFWTEVP